MSLLLDPTYLEYSPIGQFILPFFIMFAIVYGIMNYTNPFGKQKNVNAMISAAIGLFAGASRDFVEFFWRNLNLTLILFIVLFFLLVAKKLTEGGDDGDKSSIAVIAGAIIILIAAKGTEMFDDMYWLSQNNIIFLVMVALFIILIYAKGNK
ncbi:MAG: hypothetical protein KAJ91_01770 [Candidatus Aenigmarchaeota archaeon]|nr:hypothetical protein [Candidatus Aenigmarchaeota archaeon]MCK5333215.1 hypothetical protein [Candidatus Aenigmarchaeota archaeon]